MLMLDKLGVHNPIAMFEESIEKTQQLQ